MKININNFPNKINAIFLLEKHTVRKRKLSNLFSCIQFIYVHTLYNKKIKFIYIILRGS